MKLQRQFANGTAAPCTHMRVVHTGINAEQNFSTRFVKGGLTEGWLTRDGNTLLVKTDGEPLHYTILREPGYYCSSSGARIPLSESAAELLAEDGNTRLSSKEAQAWLVANGKPPGDYEVLMAWCCKLDSAQHDKLKVGA